MTELAECISYFRNLRPGGKVVLMGNSTGSQDIMHYLLSPGEQERPKIDGGIMQGCVSDREVLSMFMLPELLYQSVKMAQRYVAEGKGNDILPDRLTNSVFWTPISAKRWLSLTSPAPEHAGEDDYFSSDFGEERLSTTFGKLGGTKTPICILYGEKDQYVPENVDKVQLVDRWKSHIRRGGGIVDEGSGVVPGMSHSVKELGPPMEDMIGRVVKFLSRIEKDTESKVQQCPRTGIP